MTGPTLIASDFQSSAGTSAATLTSSAATVGTSNGDVIVVHATTWSNGTAMSTPTGGGQTFQPVQVVAPGVFAGWSGTWVCTVSGSPGTFSISSTPAGSSRNALSVERFGSAFVDPTPAVFATTQASSATMSTTLTTTAANSVISWAMSEENSRDPAGATYTPSGTIVVGLFDGHVGSNSVQYFARTGPIATAGATTVGVSVPAGSLNWTASGVEIKAQAGGAIVDLAATFTGQGTLTAGLRREVPLAATFTGTGTLADALTREVQAAASFAATGSMAATLRREVPLAAGLTATGSMAVSIVDERNLSATLTATGSMSATLSSSAQTVDLSANFTATAGMTAVFSLPIVGPTDPIAYPIAQELMACFEEQLSTLPVPPRYIQIRVGTEGGPLIGPNVDECCAGLAWIRVANVYPSWDSFPAEDNTWTPCGPLAYAVVLEMGVSFCMPWSDSDESFDNLDPPSQADWAEAFNTQMVHQTLMRRTAACCFRPTQRRAVGEWTPLPVEGGCTGGKLTVTVSVPAPCSDC
jgi:hypothetical protein